MNITPGHDRQGEKSRPTQDPAWPRSRHRYVTAPGRGDREGRVRTASRSRSARVLDDQFEPLGRLQVAPGPSRVPRSGAPPDRSLTEQERTMTTNRTAARWSPSRWSASASGLPSPRSHRSSCWLNIAACSSGSAWSYVPAGAGCRQSSDSGCGTEPVAGLLTLIGGRLGTDHDVSRGVRLGSPGPAPARAAHPSGSDIGRAGQVHPRTCSTMISAGSTSGGR